MSRMYDAVKDCIGIVGSPTMSYQLEDGYCDVMMMDFRSCLSSMMSSSMGRSLASRGTMNRSSRMSNRHRSIFLSSVSSVPLTLATFSAPSSFGALAYKVRSHLWRSRISIPCSCSPESALPRYESYTILAGSSRSVTKQL